MVSKELVASTCAYSLYVMDNLDLGVFNEEQIGDSLHYKSVN
jgi:hypothetical protein